MKGVDCKLPIQEDYRCFLNNGKSDYSSKHKKLLIAGGFLQLMTISIMIGFTFRSLTEISELRQEIELLKTSYDNLHKKVSDNFDIPEYGEVPPGVFTPNDLEEFDYGNEYYDDLSYDDDMKSDDDYNQNKNITHLLTGQQFTKDAKEATTPPRAKRNIEGYTQDEIVNSEPRRKNLTSRKNRHFTTSAPISSYSHPFYQQFRTQQDAAAFHTTPIPRSKQSRIDANPSSLVKSGDLHYSGNNPDVEFTIVTDDQMGSRRTRHRQRRLELDERPSFRTGRMRPLPSAHFSGDTSKYVYGTHENFDGNGRLRHHQQTFVDWVPSGWFQTLGMDQHFSLSDGILTIKESGLYFVYAQIYYLDEHDTNGFRVYKNESETLLQCTTMTHSMHSVKKGNTCYTAAAEYLEENDRISLGDVESSRYSLFEPGKSFFGVIKLGDVKIK